MPTGVYKHKKGSHHNKETKIKLSKLNTLINISKETLFNLYWRKRLSALSMAKIFNCSETTIFYKMKNYNIKIRTTSEAGKGKHNSPSTEFKKGCITWNKGLRKSKDIRIADYASKVSKALTKPNRLLTKENIIKHNNNKVGITNMCKILHCTRKRLHKEAKKYHIELKRKRYIPWNKDKINVYNINTLKSISSSLIKYFDSIGATRETNQYGSNWQLQRERARRRDNYTCQICNKKQGKRKLDVHHIIPFCIIYSNRLKNLVTVCQGCHTKLEAGTL